MSAKNRNAGSLFSKKEVPKREKEECHLKQALRGKPNKSLKLSPLSALEEKMENMSYLSNVALLSTFYEEKRNYFDVYLPFVVKCFSSMEVCNLEQILQNLNGFFHFEIPVNVLKTVVNDNERKYFLSQRQSSNWVVTLNEPGKALLAQIVAGESAQSRDLGLLYSRFQDYLKTRGLAAISEAALFGALSAFLLANLDRYTDKSSIRNRSASTAIDDILVHFLFDVAFADAMIEQIVERMWKGLVLLNSMSANPATKRVENFDHELAVYIDTNIIFSLLGLHNPIFSRGVSELFQLIARIPKIKVYVYDETLAEFDRILDVYDRVKESFYDIQVDTVFYFLKTQAYDRARTLALKEDIQSILEQKSIALRNSRDIDYLTSDYYSKLYGDLYGFRKERNDKLPAEMRRSENQLQRSAHHDAKVLSNVLLEKNKRTRNIQEARALFLTSSGNLYNDYLRIARRLEHYPCVIRDVSLTNWLYIINPTKDGGPQLENILGVHSRSLFVDDRVWSKYILTLRQMMDRDVISPRQFALMVSNNRAVREFLLEADRENLDEDRIREVLSELGREADTRERAMYEADALAKQSAAAAEQLKSEVDRLRAALAEEQQRSRKLAQGGMYRYIQKRIRRHSWSIVVSLCSYILFILAAVAVFYLQQKNPIFWTGLALFLFPFARSLIRHERILDTLRYCFSIKHRTEVKVALRTLFQAEYEKGQGRTWR